MSLCDTRKAMKMGATNVEKRSLKTKHLAPIFRAELTTVLHPSHFSLLASRRSVFPRMRVLTRRGVPGHMLGHHLGEFLKAHRHPAVAFHGPAIFKGPGVARVVGAFQKIF